MTNMFSVDADVEVQVVADFDSKRSVDTGVYEATIKMAYLSTAGTGSTMFNISYDINGKEIRMKPDYLYRDVKKQYYIDKKTGAKKQNIAIGKLDILCQVAAGVPLGEIKVEKKTIKVWDNTQKKEVPLPHDVFTGLLGKKVLVAMLEIQQNKYSDETQAETINELTKPCFTGSGLTLAEHQAGKTEAVWSVNWAKKNTGVMKDNFKAPAEAEGTEVTFGEPEAEGEDIFG